jgi:hypothetical protein
MQINKKNKQDRKKILGRQEMIKIASFLGYPLQPTLEDQIMPKCARLKI